MRIAFTSPPANCYHLYLYPLKNINSLVNTATHTYTTYYKAQKSPWLGVWTLETHGE